MNSIKALTDGLLILFFVSMIWLPSAELFLRLDRTSGLNENRWPAPAPRFTGGLELVETFPREFESYFNDHFGFRKPLIKGSYRLRYHLFGESGAPSVLIGKDGWLFYASGRVLSCYRGVDPFTPAELEAWRLMLEARRDALAERGIRYLFLFVPNKHTVYPEMLPDRLNLVSEVSRLDQLTAHLRAHSDIEFIDLREVLVGGKKRNQTYERTGTHWTATGRYFAQSVIVEHLKQWFPDLSPIGPLEIRSRYEVRNGYGLAAMLGMAAELQENSLLVQVKKQRARVVEAEAHLLPLKTRGRLPTAFVGQDSSLPRLMVVGDSFGEGLSHFLAQSFSRTVFAWHGFDLQVIDEEKPDVVINQIAERFLMIDHGGDMRGLRSLHSTTGR